VTEPQAPEAPASAGRGRPRPDATVERDERVLKHITASGPKTRKELAEELQVPGNEIYLSLYRLSRQSPPAVVKQGSKWQVPAAEVPAPTE
jgi:hypothetical protein